MTVDIICPLYNAERHVEKLHKSFEEQENVKINKINYIITKGKDNTIEKVQNLNCNYEIIEPTDFSHSLTREKQAFKSKADIIVFVTQDVIIKRKDWLSNLVQPIINNECDASYSRQICDNNTIEKYTRESNYPKVSRIVSNADIDTLGLKAFFFSDASSAIKRKTFVKLNGYDGKKFPTNEDMYIAYKLITNGYKINYCADSEVIHSHKFTFRQQYKRYYDTGKFFKQNKFLNNYKVNKAGGNLAKYVLNRALKDKNWTVIVNFLPNMIARYVGMKMGGIF